LGLLFAQQDVDAISDRPDFADWILRYYAAIIFHLDFELIVRQDAITKLQDLGKRGRAQAMIDVLTDVGLEHDTFALPGNSTAIDEILHDVAEFGHVSVERDGITVRQDKMREGVWMLFENGAEIS
jgi:hypothetical protein